MGRLVYSYSMGTDPRTTDTADWQANAKVIDDNGAGWHVDLTVDAADHIHIAYYDSNGGDLKYAYIPAYDSPGGDITVVTADSFLSAGTKLMINTRLETREVNHTTHATAQVYVPYISYYHASFPQTRYPVRVVWRNDFEQLRDGAVLDDFTGAWEAMTIPTANIPTDDFVCNGVPSTGTFRETAAAAGKDVTNSIIVGYLTDQYYERAYIKK
jgi:hypothetical protein